VFLDGRLHSFDTRTSFWCPTWRVWRGGLWTPTKGLLGVSFRQDDRRFRVRQKGTVPDLEPPVALDYTMTGELADDRASATGTLTARAVIGRGHDSVFCRGRVAFSAAERQH
jgi:hypothetical protein